VFKTNKNDDKGRHWGSPGNLAMKASLVVEVYGSPRTRYINNALSSLFFSGRLVFPHDWRNVDIANIISGILHFALFFGLKFYQEPAYHV
jgi:hypothetical protein